MSDAGMNIGDLFFRILADADDFDVEGAVSRELREVEQVVRRSSTQVASDWARNLEGLADAFESTRLYQAVDGMLSFVGNAFQSGMEAIGLIGGGLLGASLATGFGRLTAIEDANKRLEVMGLTAQQSDSLTKQLLETLTGTPFALDEGARSLANFVSSGVDLEKIPPMMDRIADAAAFGQVPLNEVSWVFERIARNGRVTGRELEMLNNRGLPVFTMFEQAAADAGMSVGDFLSSLSADEFFEEWDKAAAGFGENSIRIQGSAKGMGDTVSGMLANLRTAMARFGARILEPFFGSFIEIGAALNQAFGTLGDLVVPVLERITGGQAFANFVDWMTRLPDHILRAAEGFKLLGPAMGPVAGALTGMASAGLRFLPVIGRFLPVINPLVGAMIGLVLSNDELRESFGRIAAALVPVVEVVGVTLAGAMATLAEAMLPVINMIVDLLVPAFEWLGRNADWVVPPLMAIVAGIKVLPGLLRGAAGALRFLSAAFLKTPFGWIVLAIAGLVAGFKWLWDNVDGFSDFWIGVWDWMKDAAGRFTEWFTTNVAPALERAWEWIQDAASRFSDWFTSTAVPAIIAGWEWLRDAARRFADWFTTSAVPVITRAWETMQTVATTVATWFRDVAWPIIRTVAENIWSAMQTAAGFVGTAWETIRSVVGTVVGWFETYVRPTLSSVLDWLRDRFNMDSASEAWENLRDRARAVVEWFDTHVKPVFEALSDFFSSVHAKALEAIAPIWEAMGEAAEAAMTLINLIWETVLKPMTDAWIETFDELDEHWARVWRTVVIAFAIAWAIIKRVWDVIGEPTMIAMNVAWEVFKDTVETMMGIVVTIVEDGLAILTAIIETFTAFIEGDWEGFWSSLGNIVDIWTAHITSVVQTMGEWMRRTTETLRQAVVDIWEALWEKAGELVDTWTEHITRVITGFGIWMYNTTEAIRQGVIRIWNAFWRRVGEIVDERIEALRTAIRTWGEWLGRQINIIRAAAVILWRRLWDRLKSILETSWEDMRRAAVRKGGEILGYIRGLPAAMAWALRNAPSRLAAVGRAIIQGLWDGMKERWLSVARWLAERASIIAMIKGPIEKDRRLLTPHGQAIMAGLRDGLRVGWSENERMLSGFADVMADTIPDLRSKLEATVSLSPDITAADFPTSRAPAPIDVQDAMMTGQPPSPQPVEINVTQNVHTAHPKRAADEMVRQLRNAAYLGGAINAEVPL